MIQTSHRLSRRVRNRQAGSAYLVSLAVLVILSIVGLSLAVITESEMLVGAGDRTRERTFYTADSGLGAATARALALAKYEEATYELPDNNPVPGLDIKNMVQVSPFLPVLSGPCNLCEVNASGPGQQYGTKSYWKVTHAVAAQATRQGGPSAIPISQLTISAMVDVEPWEDLAESLIPLMDAEGIEKIKF